MVSGRMGMRWQLCGRTEKQVSKQQSPKSASPMKVGGMLTSRERGSIFHGRRSLQRVENQSGKRLGL